MFCQSVQPSWCSHVCELVLARCISLARFLGKSPCLVWTMGGWRKGLRPPSSISPLIVGHCVASDHSHSFIRVWPCRYVHIPCLGIIRWSLSLILHVLDTDWSVTLGYSGLVITRLLQFIGTENTGIWTIMHDIKKNRICFRDDKPGWSLYYNQVG